MTTAILLSILLSIIAASIFITVGIEDRGTVSVVADILAALSITIVIIGIITYAFYRFSLIIALW